jgi:uncharacterized protein (DUF1697 family)
MAGHNTVKTKDLAEMFADLGYPDAKIFIQSGNIIFRSKEERHKLSVQIEGAISEKFSFDIDVMLRTVEEVKALATRNPYLNEEKFNPARMGVVFLKSVPGKESVARMDSISFPPDKFMIDKQEIFLFCPDGFGRSKLNTNFFERKLGVPGTARNWKTINSILELAEKM